jgi:hypothetical protein
MPSDSFLLNSRYKVYPAAPNARARNRPNVLKIEKKLSGAVPNKSCKKYDKSGYIKRKLVYKGDKKRMT